MICAPLRCISSNSRESDLGGNIIFTLDIHFNFFSGVVYCISAEQKPVL